MMMRIASMFTVWVFGRVGLHACVLLLLLAAGEGVANLVDAPNLWLGRLAPHCSRCLSPASAPAAFSSGELCFVDVLVGHGLGWVKRNPGPGADLAA